MTKSAIEMVTERRRQRDDAICLLDSAMYAARQGGHSHREIAEAAGFSSKGHVHERIARFSASLGTPDPETAEATP